MRGGEFLRGVIAVSCWVGSASFSQAQWAANAQGSEPSLPSFIDKRKLRDLTLPPAQPKAPAASEGDEETRRRAEELSKKFSSPGAGSPVEPAGDRGRGEGSAIGAANGQPPGGTPVPKGEEALRRELEAANQRANEAEERARKERAERLASEAESRKALEQAAAAVAKAQEEARQAARRAAEAEKRAGRAQEQKEKGVGFKPPAAPAADGKVARQASSGQQTATRAPVEQRGSVYDRRAQDYFGLGSGRPVK